MLSCGHTVSVQQAQSHQCKDVLVWPPSKDSSEVAEAQPPAQQAPPVGVAVVVVVDDTGETQRHVPKERSVLHYMGVSCGGRERYRERG